MTILATGRNAYTFVELLVVILIIGILVATVLPQLKQATSGLELEGFVKDIYYLCKYLQASAVSQGKLYRLNIAPESLELNATFKEKDELPLSGTGFKPIEGRFAKTYYAPKGSIIEVTAPTDNQIYFYPDGSIDQAQIHIRNKEGKELAISSKGVSLEITTH